VEKGRHNGKTLSLIQANTNKNREFCCLFEEGGIANWDEEEKSEK
jgi:hypothetical protein